MTTTYGNPFQNPATAPQPGVLTQFPGAGTMIPTTMSSLTPGMAAVQAYRARGGVPLGGGGLTRTGTALGMQGGGDTSGLGAAQAMQGQIQPTQPSTQPSPYGTALSSMNALRPPSGYQTSNPGGVQTMMGGPVSLGYQTRTGGGMGSMGLRMQGPPNAGGVRVGGIRPPNMRAMNSRY